MLYIGRFAPSPTGPLHLGSLVAALASYLDAQVHGGQWLLRIDDADLSRVVPTAADQIIAQLRHYGFAWHGKPMYTQDNKAQHAAALDTLVALGAVYGCRCSRAQVEANANTNLKASLGSNLITSHETLYAGTCRHLNLGLTDPSLRSVRLRVGSVAQTFADRWPSRELGSQRYTDALADTVGDFVLWRPEFVSAIQGGAYAYQLTMPVDDANAGVTHVVRGADLLGVTARQLYIYDLLAQPKPSYMHVPLVFLPNGLKLSKQHGAPALPYLANTDPVPALNLALQHLGLQAYSGTNLAGFWSHACAAWTKKLQLFNPTSVATTTPANPVA